MTAKDMHNDVHNRLVSEADVGLIYSADGFLTKSGRTPRQVRLDHLDAIVRREIAAELIRQADDLAERIRMHGLGRHSVDPCLRCEAWGQAEAVLRARARELGWEG